MADEETRLKLEEEERERAEREAERKREQEEVYSAALEETTNEAELEVRVLSLPLLASVVKVDDTVEHYVFM